jgi:hypothetical protein
MGAVEFIRLEVGGQPPVVLSRTGWSGGDPTKAEFETYARTALKGFYEPGLARPKAGVGFWHNGTQLVPEAVRFMNDDRTERWRLSLRDMIAP